jgi:uncharacterized protein (DUF924 family)
VNGSGTPLAPEAQALLDFWRAAGPQRWFKKDAAFDATFRSRFLPVHEAAARGDLDAWNGTPEGALALLLLLDQFPRNAFRGSARMFATDARALAFARDALQRGLDALVDSDLRQFFHLPFMHSEDLHDQERSVELAGLAGGESLRYAILHRDIVQRFGRFPHRNAVLGRTTTPEEQQFLDEGGFAG